MHKKENRENRNEEIMPQIIEESSKLKRTKFTVRELQKTSTWTQSHKISENQKKEIIKLLDQQQQKGDLNQYPTFL